MNKLYIDGFKVFSKETEIIIGENNILFYGENGSGKSSIFEAIKIIFLRDILEKRKISITATPEEEEQIKNDLYSSYNNRSHGHSLRLEINDTDYKNFDSSNYQVFMISPETLSIGASISLKEILTNVWFKIDNIDTLINDWHEIIAEEVTKQMSELFKEPIKIVFDASDNFKCIVSDPERNLSRKEELNSSFNEAKLHLIKLLILFNIIHINFKTDPNIKKIIVLDDFITSLDAANRTFLIRYILDKFQNFQKIIFTHNISFYNLVRYTICQINKEQDNWSFLNLYMMGNLAHTYQQSSENTVNKIKEEYYQRSDVEQTGNRIRKRFEVLLYELSKLLQIGTLEESSKIIELLSRNEPIYFDQSGKTINDLMKEIETTLNSPCDVNLKQRLLTKINDYRKTDYANLRAIIKDLTLYQKVSMHPMSHGTIGLTQFTNKEIKESLVLLEKLENILIFLKNVNVTSV